MAERASARKPFSSTSSSSEGSRRLLILAKAGAYSRSQGRSRRFFDDGAMSTTGPWDGSRFRAPQSRQVGVVSVCPTITKVGTATRPPQQEQVPTTAGGEEDVIRTSPVEVTSMSERYTQDSMTSRASFVLVLSRPPVPPHATLRRLTPAESLVEGEGGRVNTASGSMDLDLGPPAAAALSTLFPGHSGQY